MHYCIIHKDPRGLFKTEGEAPGFQQFRRDLANVFRLQGSYLLGVCLKCPIHTLDNG